MKLSMIQSENLFQFKSLTMTKIFKFKPRHLWTPPCLHLPSLIAFISSSIKTSNFNFEAFSLRSASSSRLSCRIILFYFSSARFLLRQGRLSSGEKEAEKIIVETMNEACVSILQIRGDFWCFFQCTLVDTDKIRERPRSKWQNRDNLLDQVVKESLGCEKVSRGRHLILRDSFTFRALRQSFFASMTVKEEEATERTS